ncbi:MAG: tRNA pseudouridine(55) synthase TruB [Lachnospiraceae bacterium]|nr:tRNA pseudouridine(55) synthase TruB [Lachnospiraceae bacterium]
MYNGVINIYKEKGYTSHDVVAKLRGILKQKKIGHTGTLDPDATGVLPVCLGNGTRLCDMLTDRTKEYKVTMLLGVTTDTEDISGTILTEQKVTADVNAITDAIMSFVGSYDQIPPMYSAIKVNGHKLYELARKGVEVERKPRNVVIDYIKIDSVGDSECIFTVGCSKGTYIRSLCRDIGAKLGCGACMKDLVRTRSGICLAKDALTLDEVERKKAAGTLEECIKPVDFFFMDYPAAVLPDAYEKYVKNGNMFKAVECRDGHLEADDVYKVRIYFDRKEKGPIFTALYEYDRHTGIYKPYKMFLNGE